MSKENQNSDHLRTQEEALVELIKISKKATVRAHRSTLRKKNTRMITVKRGFVYSVLDGVKTKVKELPKVDTDLIPITFEL